MEKAKALLAQVWPPALIMGAFALYLYMDPGPGQPQPVANVTCLFTAQEGQARIKLGQYTAPLSRVEIEGQANASTRDWLHDFDGTAFYSFDEQPLKASVRGRLYMGKDMNIDAVLFTVEDGGFGKGGLNLYTLDKEGQLNSEGETQVYAYTSVDFKMLHPMNSACTATRYEAKSWWPFS